MKVIYTDTPGTEPGACYRLLSEFFGVIGSATEVLVQGDAPNITDAYKSAGIKVSAVDGDGLRLDGPTVGEYVAAGYQASAYPPAGYLSRSTGDEIAAAVAAQAAGPETDPLKMTVPDLKNWLTAKGIAFEPSAKKEDLQTLVPKE